MHGVFAHKFSSCRPSLCSAVPLFGRTLMTSLALAREYSACCSGIPLFSMTHLPGFFCFGFEPVYVPYSYRLKNTGKHTRSTDIFMPQSQVERCIPRKNHSVIGTREQKTMLYGVIINSYANAFYTRKCN